MEPPLYQYQPLQHSDSARVLILHPSPNESDRIECTMCHKNLSDGSLCYEAVSYTWGNSGLTHVIYCNDAKQRLSVGRNCYAALRRLRLPKKSRSLWIDAVCINQEDPHERGHQVRLMNEVYNVAARVIIMLSDQIPDCRLLLEGVTKAREFIAAGMELGPSTKHMEDWAHSRAMIQQLETLFEDPWFKRTWVLQEVYLKDRVTIIYGSIAMDYHELEMLYYGFNNRRNTRTNWPLPLQLIREKSKIMEEYSTIQFSLWNRLYCTRKCLATDPRDKVFALKSLVGSGQDELNRLIDYAQSVEDCFKRVATFLLPVLGLRILTATRHPHGLDMSSWMPDWSQASPLEFHPFHYECFGDKEEDGVVSPDDVESKKRVLRSYSYEESQLRPKLHLVGCRVAPIIECSLVFHFVDHDDADRQMSQIYNQFGNIRQHLAEECKLNSIKIPGHFSGKIFDGKARIDKQHVQR